MKGRAMMTIRVSRDGGKTYGPTRVVRSTGPLAPRETSVWPPCQCPQCASGVEEQRALLALSRFPLEESLMGPLSRAVREEIRGWRKWRSVSLVKDARVHSRLTGTTPNPLALWSRSEG
jgi:hypothetical protein